jgi:hypothetical protein
VAEGLPGPAPAFYARPGGTGGWRDWWALLHPPYTAWHLSYVVIGACLAPSVDGVHLLATVLAFFLAVGVAAHAADELHDRPLGTGISRRALVAATAAGLAGAVAIGVAGVVRVGPGLLPFILVGAVVVLAYNLEVLGGRLHTAATFALAWGAFPVLTAYYAQVERLSGAAVAAAVAASALSAAQRQLSTPARTLRRRVRTADVTLTLRDGSRPRLAVEDLLAPLEGTLRWLTAATVALALALALARLGPGGG